MREGTINKGEREVNKETGTKIREKGQTNTQRREQREVKGGRGKREEKV